MIDAQLRTLLLTLNPRVRDDLRSVPLRDQPNRDAIASRLMRYRDGHGDDSADIIDMLRMTPEKRRQLVGCSGSSMRWKDANHSNQGLDGGIRRG